MRSNVVETIPARNCTGCECCVGVCPGNALEMREDAEGFCYPFVIEERCNKCGICVKKCPVLSGESSKEKGEMPSLAFAGYAREEALVEQSSSGGFFGLIARKILAGGGFVTGAAWTQGFRSVEHVVCERVEDLGAIQRSKYIQSRKRDIYRTTIELLKRGKKVLFSGCPCEAAAMASICPKELRKKLYLIDLVCMGPTSGKAMRDFVDTIQQKNHAHVQELNMRHALEKWVPYGLYVAFDNGKKLLDRFYETPIGDAAAIMQRPSCYSCRFVSPNRSSDLTLGDCHGVDESAPYYHKSGTSIALPNTPKGEELLEILRQSGACLEAVETEQLLRHNPRIAHTWEPRAERSLFSTVFVSQGLFAASKAITPFKKRLYRKVPFRQRKHIYKIARSIREFLS